MSIEEKIAEYAHNAWSGWMKYLFGKSIHNDDGTVTIPSWAVSRWNLQLNTPYKDLPEEMKDSDRDEAKQILSLIQIEVNCKDCFNGVVINAMGGGQDDLHDCEICKGTGKITKTPESGDVGRIV